MCLSCGLDQCLLKLCPSLLCFHKASFTSSIKQKDLAHLSFHHPCTSHWCSAVVLPPHLLFQFPLVGIFILFLFFFSYILYTAWDTLWKCCIQFPCLWITFFQLIKKPDSSKGRGPVSHTMHDIMHLWGCSSSWQISNFISTGKLPFLLSFPYTVVFWCSDAFQEGVFRHVSFL